jgi:uncharacterized membrane protein
MLRAMNKRERDAPWRRHPVWVGVQLAFGMFVVFPLILLGLLLLLRYLF